MPVVNPFRDLPEDCLQAVRNKRYGVVTTIDGCSCVVPVDYMRRHGFDDHDVVTLAQLVGIAQELELRAHIHMREVFIAAQATTLVTQALKTHLDRRDAEVNTGSPPASAPTDS